MAQATPAPRPATELTGFGQFMKWVGLPVALLAVGYFFVGPRVGGKRLGSVPVIRSLADKLRSQSENPTPAEGPKPPARRTSPSGTTPPRSGASEAQEFERLRVRPPLDDVR